MAPPLPGTGTLAERILADLRQRDEGASDAALAHALGVRRQAIGAACRSLAARGLVERARHDGRVVTSSLPVARIVVAQPRAEASGGVRPWSWEGNVQRAAAAFLRAGGWEIVGEADAASREPGKDIRAIRGDETLWVTVKGYPERTARTRPATQARHWYAAAIFDVVRYRQEDPHARLAIALPDVATYRSLARRTAWLESAAPFAFVWIGTDGSATSDLHGG